MDGEKIFIKNHWKRPQLTLTVNVVLKIIKLTSKRKKKQLPLMSMAKWCRNYRANYDMGEKKR